MVSWKKNVNDTAPFNVILDRNIGLYIHIWNDFDSASVISEQR